MIPYYLHNTHPSYLSCVCVKCVYGVALYLFCDFMQNLRLICIFCTYTERKLEVNLNTHDKYTDFTQSYPHTHFPCHHIGLFLLLVL